MPQFMTPTWRRLVCGARTGRSDAFEKHLREIARPTQITFVRMMKQCVGNPVGFEFRHELRETWAVVLPEPTPVDSDRWRMLTFDRRGFQGHLVFRSIDIAVEQMIHSGYREPDPGVLDRIVAEPLWGIAQAQHDCQSKVFSKKITLEEYLAEMNAIAARHGVVVERADALPA